MITARLGDDHLTDEKEVVQGIEGVDRARPAHRDHGRSHLATEDAPICLSYQAGAVHQRLDLRGHVGHIGRRAEQNAVRLLHLFYVLVAHVAGLSAAMILALRTFAAGQAAMNLLAAHLHEFGFNALVFQQVS